MADLKQLNDLTDFVMNAPLYAEYLVNAPGDMEPLFRGPLLRIDGHCPGCGKETTYFRSTAMHDSTWNKGIYQKAFDNPIINSTYNCSRNHTHQLNVIYHVEGITRIQKIGQLPSLASIAQDETRTYRSVLRGEASSEFHKAIGLAAHGVGIGSFVYLRRIFERLVIGRYESHKAEKEWTDEQFYSLRMGEKISFLKDYLPSFLVENRNIYGILSRGIHELSEKDCLSFFPVLKASIIYILEDDRRKLDDLKRRDEIAKALAQFGSGSSDMLT